jgi:hypothetical protein
MLFLVTLSAAATAATGCSACHRHVMMRGRWRCRRRSDPILPVEQQAPSLASVTITKAVNSGVMARLDHAVLSHADYNMHFWVDLSMSALLMSSVLK